MKKTFYLIACMVSYTSIVRAQTIIPKFGISLSTISENKNEKLGVLGGLAVEFPLTKRISIQPEVLYSQKGYKYGSVSDGNIITLNYLEVPVLVKAKFNHFYFNIGPSLVVGLDGDYKLTTTNPVIQHNINGKIKFGKHSDENQNNDSYIDRRFDIGLQIGGGYILANLIMIDLRYGFGMIDIYSNGESKLRSFQVTLGVPIRLGKSKKTVRIK